jgi:hypothetical protein
MKVVGVPKEGVRPLADRFGRLDGLGTQSLLKEIMDTLSAVSRFEPSVTR